MYDVIRKINPVIEIFLEQNHNTEGDSFRCAHYIFTLLHSYSRETIFSAVREALADKTPTIAAVSALLSDSSTNFEEQVVPQQRELLELDYKPRTLETYENDFKK